MKQSRLMSLLESCGNTASGFVISLFAQWLILPWLLGVEITVTQNLTFAVIMTAISIARSYGWRRLMEATGVRMKLSPFMQAVIAERARQASEEGWTTEHDDGHEHGELARAGAAYFISAANGSVDDARPPSCWPWEKEWWKPDGVRRDLVKGGALGIAEGEKFDRTRRRRAR